MKITLKGCMLATAAFLGFGLTSCQSDEPAMNMENSERPTVSVTMTAGIADLEKGSRATLTPQGNQLKFAWEKNDAIHVVNASDGELLGTLRVTEVNADPRFCTFKGDIVDPGKNASLNFYYLGKKGTVEAPRDKNYVAQDLTVDFSNQTGTVTELYDYDIQTATKAFPDGISGGLGTVNFNRDFSFGRFVLKVDGEELDLANVPVTISAASGTLNSKAVLGFRNRAFTYQAGEITVTPAANDFFVNLLPSAAVSLKFTCTVNGEPFEGTKGSEILGNRYYCDGVEGAPIVVEMRSSRRVFGIRYNAAFEGAVPAQYLDSKSVDANVSSVEFTILDYAATGLPAREGYRFLGWSSTADGQVSEEIGAEVVLYQAKTIDLYAIWAKNETEYTIHFNAEGTGTNPADITRSSADDSVIVTPLPDGAGLVKTGYDFAGWSDKPFASQDGNTSGANSWTLTKENPEVTLYPVWKKKDTTVTTPGYGHGEFN